MSKCSRLQVSYGGRINIHATQVLFFVHSLLMISKTKKKKKKGWPVTQYTSFCVWNWSERKKENFHFYAFIVNNRVLLYFTTGTNLILMSQKQTASHKNVRGHSWVFVTSESLLSFLFLLFF